MDKGLEEGKYHCPGVVVTLGNGILRFSSFGLFINSYIISKFNLI